MPIGFSEHEKEFLNNLYHTCDSLVETLDRGEISKTIQEFYEKNKRDNNLQSIISVTLRKSNLSEQDVEIDRYYDLAVNYLSIKIDKNE